MESKKITQKITQVQVPVEGTSKFIQLKILIWRSEFGGYHYAIWTAEGLTIAEGGFQGRKAKFLDAIMHNEVP